MPRNTTAGTLRAGHAAAFPDIHRELESFYFDDNVVVVELSLNGEHNGDLATASTNGKITSFHCYLAVTIILAQLGVI